MTALADLLADPDQFITLVAELTYRDPDTDTVSTKRITTTNWKGTESGYLRGRLVNPGTHEVSVEADSLGGIASLSLNTLRFDNIPPSIGGAGPLDFLRDKSLSGRSVQLLAGSPTEAIAEYEAVGSGLADGEPEFDDGSGLMLVRLKSALERLQQDLDIRTYVGEPNALKILTSTGMATVANNAAHHLTEFTLAGRFKASTVTGTATPVLSQRQTGVTASNWRVRLNPASAALPGIMIASYSVGGTGNAVQLTSSGRFDDSDDHAWVFARNSTHAYLMVDGTVVASTTNPGSPDQPTAGVVMGSRLEVASAWFNDSRILNHYIPPDEMRAAMAVRASGDEGGLVGLWRGDDNVGTTLTDDSSTGANATISGVEDTDFSWMSSDLGGPDRAGTSMLSPIGEAGSYRADLVDSFRERWLYSDSAPSGSYTLTVRDQGEELTGGGTDYTDDGGVVALVSEAGEPLTTAVARNDAAARVDQVLQEILVTRGPLSSSDVDFRRLLSLFGNKLGTVTRRQPVRDVATELLRGIESYAALNRDGDVAFDSIIPPISPGPRGGSCAEIASAPGSAFVSNILWATGGSVVPPDASGHSFTLMGWYKLPALAASDFAFGDVPLLRLLDPSLGQEIRWTLDAWSGARLVEITSYNAGSTFDTKSTNAGAVFELPETRGPDWWFLAVVNDSAANTCTFLAARQGGTLTTLGSTAALTAAPAADFTDAEVGGDGSTIDQKFQFYRGGMAEPTVIASALTTAKVQEWFDDPDTATSTPAFRAELDGLSTASLTDSASSTVGVVTGDVAERPDLVVDLRETPRPFNRRQLVPASRIEVRYARNFDPLGPAEISGLVPDDERAAQQQEWKSVVWEDPEVAADYLDARDVVVDSPWATSVGASAALRLERIRRAPGREYATLGPTADAPLRSGLILEIGEEIRIYDHQDLSDGVSYRVIGNRRMWDTLDCELTTWR